MPLWIRSATDRGLTHIEATAEGVAERTDYVRAWPGPADERDRLDVASTEGKKARTAAAVIPLTASTAMPLQRDGYRKLFWLKRLGIGEVSAGGAR